MTTTLPAPVTLHIDGLRVESEANAHTHWRARQRRAAAQRLVVRAALSWRDLSAFKTAPRLRVTFRRVKGPRGRDMDSDNLAGAFKAVRDEVAAVIGRDDGDRWFDWRYDPVQTRGKDFGVRITLESLPAAGEG